ncbi:hypothetical protein [Stieleria maiorica]|nr:hypothetical protein [Stieleria maiorica]
MTGESNPRLVSYCEIHAMIVSDSYIANAFIGFHYGRIYQLGDGTTWKIVDVRCRLGSQIKPKATVRKRRNDYVLKVSAIGLAVEVVPVETPYFDDPIEQLPESPADFQQWLANAIQTEVAMLKRARAKRSHD